MKAALVFLAVLPLAGCVTLDKGAEANVPTVTCVLSFGNSCQFKGEKTLDKVHAEGSLGKTVVEPAEFPPVGQHALP